MKKYLLLIATFFILAHPAFASVQSSIDTGLACLLANQNPDSSVGSQPELLSRDTEEVLFRLSAINEKGVQFQNSLRHQ